MKTFANVDDYIADFSPEIQDHLKAIRSKVTETAPNAIENISYGMPAYKYKGKPMAYFAGHQKHIGFYATPQGHEAFQKELSKYKQGKGSVQFPLDAPMPLDLIAEMVKFRMQLIDEKKK